MRFNGTIAGIGLALATATAWGAPAGRGASAQAHAPAMGAPAMGAPAKGAPAMGAPAKGAPAMGAPAMGLSVGSPTEGHLVGAVRLADAPYLRIVPAYGGGDVRWGVGAMVGMLDRAARNVRRQFPEAVMSLGHISRQNGGELDRHASHESGRDADVQFYVRNEHGKPAYSDHFVAFQGDGTAPSWPGAHFDDARNWALVAALMNDPVAHVSHIFVATPMRARLLAYAARVQVSQALRDRAALTMLQPHGSLPHDDHFHVRISCPSGMQGCVENPTGSQAARAKRHGFRVPSAGPSAHHDAARPVHAVHPVAPAKSRIIAPPATGAVVETGEDSPQIAPDFAPPAMMIDELDDADGS